MLVKSFNPPVTSSSASEEMPAASALKGAAKAAGLGSMKGRQRFCWRQWIYLMDMV